MADEEQMNIDFGDRGRHKKLPVSNLAQQMAQAILLTVQDNRNKDKVKHLHLPVNPTKTET